MDVQQHLAAWRRATGRPDPVSTQSPAPGDYPGDDRPTVEVSRESLVRYLAATCRKTDREIAVILWIAPAAVRRIRRKLGIRGNPYRSGWEDQIRAAHAAGLSNAQIVARTGYALRSVQQLLYRLGLRANRG